VTGGIPSGSEMNITFVHPRPELRPYVESLWICESETGGGHKLRGAKRMSQTHHPLQELPAVVGRRRAR